MLSLLLVVTAITMTTSRPIAQSQCLKPNAYTWELYSILVGKPQDLTACERSLGGQGYNPYYCSSNYIHVLNIIQKDHSPTTPAAVTSGSGAQPVETTATNSKCNFDAKFTLSKGNIMGGDIVFYKHSSSSGHFEVLVYNKEKDNQVLIGSSSFPSEGTGWNRIEINHFSASLGRGNHAIHLSVQFIRNGEEVSCQEVQNTFVIDCKKGHDDSPSTTFNYAPALVLITQGDSYLLGHHNRAGRDAAKCKLQARKVSLESADPQGLVTTTEVDIGQCVDVSQPDVECAPKQTKELQYITKDDRDTFSIETINSITAC